MGFSPDQNYSVKGKELMRLVRMTLEEEGANCKEMEKTSSFWDGLIGLGGLALGVFAFFTMPVSFIVATGVIASMVVMKTTVGNESINRDCADIPFKELDEKMKARQAEQNKKITEQTEILKEINAKLSQTLEKIDDVKREMNAGFQRVLDRVGDLDASNPVSDIKTAIESIAFSEENKRLATPDNYVYIIQQEVAKKSYDSSLYNYIGKQGSLYKGIFSVINKKSTINLSIALPALNAGVTTYASTVFNLFHQLRYMSEYSYQKGDLKKFNSYYEQLVFDFNTYKLILNGSAKKQGMIDQIAHILRDAKENLSKQELGDELFDNIERYITELEQLKEKIANQTLAIIESTPENNIDINFNTRTGEEKSSTPFLDWKEGAKVSYAVQFEKDGNYSKVSGWTSPQEIGKTANPDIEVRKKSDKNRLIFRKFDNGEAELAYVLPASEIKFRDVHRDLYNLPSKSSLTDVDVVSIMEKLVNFGASGKAVFEGKRTAIHAAAAAGRTGMLVKLLDKDSSLITQVDKNGYTALHVAAEEKKTQFAEELIKRGANVNAVINEYNVTPLHLAVRYHAEEIVDSLLGDEKINPNITDAAGLSPLHYAIIDEDYNHHLLVKLINNHKIDLNIKDKNGLAPLHYATIINRWRAAKKLSDDGYGRINMYAKDNQNMSALHYDAMKGNQVDILLLAALGDGKGSVLNEGAGEKQWTPLHFAAFFKQTGWLNYLYHSSYRITSQINLIYQRH